MINVQEEASPERFGSVFRELDRRSASAFGSEDFGKIGAHQHERMVERTGFPAEHADKVQRAVDTLGLSKGVYHLPLRTSKGTLVGYAQFRSVPNRKSPVLVTVLGASMRPSGQNIESMIKLNGFRETSEMLAPIRHRESPGRQESDGYAIERAFNNLNQSTGLAIESGR